MGSCISSDNTSGECESQTCTAKVATIKGDLAEFQASVAVSQVLQTDAPSSFLCNSDSLLFNDFISALDLDDELQASQIYFVLPSFKLQNKLSASDMAALAVKASVALQNGSKNRRTKQSRISPVLLSLTNQSVEMETKTKAETSFHRKLKPFSVWRLQGYTSRRAKLAARSFRLRLGTISEGTVI